MSIKIPTIMLAEAIAKELASAKRGANTSKNPTIKQCHQQTAQVLSNIAALIPLNVQELYITEIEPKK